MVSLSSGDSIITGAKGSDAGCPNSHFPASGNESGHVNGALHRARILFHAALYKSHPNVAGAQQTQETGFQHVLPLLLGQLGWQAAGMAGGVLSSPLLFLAGAAIHTGG